jgi:hypothetical protein
MPLATLSWRAWGSRSAKVNLNAVCHSLVQSYEQVGGQRRKTSGNSDTRTIKTGSHRSRGASRVWRRRDIGRPDIRSRSALR